MNRKTQIILTSLTVLATAGGVAVAMMQTRPEDPIAVATPSPSVTPSISPTATPSPSPTPSASPSSQPSPTPNEPAASPKPPSREVTSCRVTMVRVNDPESPLNVRSSPTTAEDNVVGQVENGTYLSVSKEQDGWFQVTDPVAGWVVKSRTEFGCNEKVERVFLGTGNTSTEVSDRLVGTGFHKYLFNAKAGQTLTVTRQSGPFPMILLPNGDMLAELVDERDRWSGTLPASGDYTLQLDSNYKGYAYSFLVTIE